MVQRAYEFNYGEPGLFMEIYVAKKAEFQPLLYQTLTAGFDLKKVRSHFRSKAEAIRRFMRRNRQLHDFSSYRINHFGNVFTGYSLYEVDGTFDGGVQERTQVVRVIFVPPLAQFSKGLEIPRGRRLAYASHFLRFWTHNTDSYDAHRNALYFLSLANVTSFGNSRDGLTTWGFSPPAIFSMRSAPVLVNSIGMDSFASPKKSSGSPHSGTSPSTA